MGIAFRHFGGLVAQHFADGQQACPVHRQVARCGVPENMKTKVFKTGFLHCHSLRLAQIGWFFCSDWSPKDQPRSHFQFGVLNDLRSALLK